jgi:hypothetical protein
MLAKEVVSVSAARTLSSISKVSVSKEARCAAIPELDHAAIKIS